MFLRVDGITRSNDHGQIILKDISFSQHRAQKLAIIGETGSGKSTLLKVIAGLLDADHGTVMLNGSKVAGAAERLVPGHPEIKYLSQHFDLPKSLRVEQVLEYSNVLSHNKVQQLISLCDIQHVMKRRTDELSGGERQRIALARLLMSSPHLLLLDEPYSNLDTVHKSALQQVIMNISRRLKVGCILVSHDREDILPWADVILAMRNGRIVQVGSPQEIYFRPVDEYVAGLFGAFNIFTQAEHPKLFPANPAQNTLIIRPERISVIRGRVKGGWRGTVTEVSFYGSHWQLKVDDGKKEIIAYQMELSLKAGDAVSLELVPAN